MNTEVKILVIGRNPSMMTRVLDMLAQHNYSAVGRFDDAEAIATFKAQAFKAVIIGGGVDAESRQKLHTQLKELSPNVKIVDGHPHSILQELEHALSK